MGKEKRAKWLGWLVWLWPTCSSFARWHSDWYRSISKVFFFTKGKWPGIRNKLYFGVQTMVSSQKQPQLMPCTTEVQKEWAAGHSSGASTWSSLCLHCLDGKDEVLITACIYLYIYIFIYLYIYKFVYLYICIFIFIYLYIYIFIYLYICIFVYLFIYLF